MQPNSDSETMFSVFVRSTRTDSCAISHIDSQSLDGGIQSLKFCRSVAALCSFSSVLFALSIRSPPLGDHTIPLPQSADAATLSLASFASSCTMRTTPQRPPPASSSSSSRARLLAPTHPARNPARRPRRSRLLPTLRSTWEPAPQPARPQHLVGGKHLLLFKSVFPRKEIS